MTAAFVPQIRLYQDWLKENLGLEFESYEALWEWSTTDLNAFWQSIWDFRGLKSSTPYDCVLCKDQMPGGEWFRGATVNLASVALQHVDAAEAAGQPAIICETQGGIAGSEAEGARCSSRRSRGRLSAKRARNCDRLFGLREHWSDLEYLRAGYGDKGRH